VPDSLDFEVRVYAAMVDALALYHDELEIEGAFNWRDSIAERLKSGEQLSPESAALLKHADDQLMRQREMLVRRFAAVFDPERKATILQSLWWWHLDEGPQVRAEAREVA
jgi:hypothetical protein